MTITVLFVDGPYDGRKVAMPADSLPLFRVATHKSMVPSMYRADAPSGPVDHTTFDYYVTRLPTGQYVAYPECWRQDATTDPLFRAVGQLWRGYVGEWT